MNELRRRETPLLTGLMFIGIINSARDSSVLICYRELQRARYAA